MKPLNWNMIFGRCFELDCIRVDIILQMFECLTTLMLGIPECIPLELFIFTDHKIYIYALEGLEWGNLRN